MTDTTTNTELGAVLGGMIAFDQALSNRLHDDVIDTAIRWVTRYRKLYDQVEENNRDLYVDRVLQGQGYYRDDVDRVIEHLEGLKMVGER